MARRQVTATDHPLDRWAEAARAQLLAGLRAVVPAGVPVALLGVPMYTNAGDAALALGELRALAALGNRIAYLSPESTFSPARLERLAPEATILLQAGGNVGDLWPENQRFREDVLARFPGRRVVQLPQSIAFSDGAALERAQRAFAAHPDFTLLLRDRPSLDFARERFACASQLAPDMALALPRRPAGAGAGGSGAGADGGGAGAGILWIRRGDHERRATDVEPQDAGIRSLDWPDDLDRVERATRRAVFALGARSDRLGRLSAVTGPMEIAAYDAFARRRVARALALLDGVDVLITERLHGLILATLRGIPVVALDNVSGKLGAFVATWLAEVPSVRVASGGSDAVALARELLPRR